MTGLIKAALLLFFFSLCGAAFIVTHHLRAKTPAPVPHELFAVVSEQLAAVRADDYVNAYRYSASGVQQKFTLPQFEAMVRQSYDFIARGDRVEFGAAQVKGGAASVNVFFISSDGDVRSFVFSLTAESSRWKISGVREQSVHSRRAPLAGLHV